MKRTAWLNSARPAQLRQICTDLLRAGKHPGEKNPLEGHINSPLFTALSEHLRSAGRCTLLDLGPALGANVDFFGALHCKLQIADCGTALLELNARTDIPANDYEIELEQLLPLDGIDPCDGVLVWDLLNYLDKPLFGALMRHLSPVVSGDTWLHGYINSRREMTALPQQYRLDQEGRVMVTAVTGTRSCPSYPQQTLRTLMPDFSVARATLLQNGMQEYLFKGQGHGHRQRGRLKERDQGVASR